MQRGACREFDVLLVFMFDRIGRIDDETPFIVEWFVKTAGVEVWSVKEGEQRFETHVVFCEQNGIEKYMKFPMFKKETKDRKYYEDPFRAVNFRIDEQEDR